MSAARTFADIRVQLLGPIRAWRGDEELDVGPASRRAVLGLLALVCGRPLSRTEIVDGMWHLREPPPTATNVIHTHIKNLRRALEPDRPPRTPGEVLRQVGDGYGLYLPDRAVDLWWFRQHIADAVTAQRQGRLDTAADQVAAALALWRGEPLAGLPVLASHPKVVALESERQAAVALYGDVMIEAGRAAEVLALLEEVAAAQRWDEAGHARLIHAYRAAGRRGQAFATFHEVRRRLADELGVEPGTDLSAAHAALLRDDEPAPSRKANPAQLPLDVPDFVGRSAELAELDRLDAEEGGLCVLSGTAGVGKTALAVHWAHRGVDRYPDGQVYVNLRGYDPDQPIAVADALAHLLSALDVPLADLPPGVDARAARFRTEMDRRRMLVVLDNAATADQVRPLLPGTGTCTVLVTSRASLAGLVARDGAHRLELDLLPPTDAHGLLGRLIGPRAVADVDAVSLLAERCARLPLALRVAAELVVSRPAVPLADLVDELRLDLLDADGDPRGGVTAVFSWSIRHLSDEAARTFRLMGLHPGPDIDADAVAALIEAAPEDARRRLETLVRAHLVHPTAAGRYGMHDLLRAYAASLAAGEDPRALDRMFDHYVATAATATATLFPADAARRPAFAATPTTVPRLETADAARRWLETERANLVAVATFTAAHGRPAHTIRLAATISQYIDGAHHTDSLAVNRAAYRAACATGSAPDQGRALHDLGISHIRLGEYDLATDHLERARDVFARGGDRTQEARTLSLLGVVHARTGRRGDAADLFRRVLDAVRELGDGGGEANVLSNLGILDAEAGRFEAAADHFRQAVTVAERLGDVVRQANAIGNLGKVEGLLHNDDTAVDLLQKALAAYRRLGDRGGEARTLDNLATIWTRLDRHPQAAASFDRALAGFRAIGDRGGEATVLNGQGGLFLATGRPADALASHTAALALATELGHPDEQARAHAGLGHANRSLGDLDAGRHHYERALTLYTDLGSPEAESINALLTH